MVTNVEQLIPNGKGKDYPRETRMGLECVCQYMMCFQSLSPLIYLCLHIGMELKCDKNLREVKDVIQKSGLDMHT